MQYIIKKKENILHLSKVAPKKLWRKILSSKTKDNNKISLEDWNAYLKNLYKSSNVINNIQILHTDEDVFSLEDIDIGVRRLANGKTRDIEGY